LYGKKEKPFLFFLHRCKKIGVFRGHVAQRIATCLSRACPQKIPPWIFCGVGDLPANLRGAKPRIRALFNVWQERGKKKRSLSQSKGTVPKEMNCPQRKKSELGRWNAGKKQGAGYCHKKIRPWIFLWIAESLRNSACY